MSRRITAAIVGVTAFVLLALGIPLALVFHRFFLKAEVVELQAAAAQTLTEIDVPLDTTALAALADEPDAPPPFSIYDPNGTLIFGEGPQQASEPVLRAATGSIASGTRGRIVVATPITGAGEQIVGVLMLSEPLAEADRRVRSAWGLMAIAGLGALLAAWLLARRLAGRLTRPLSELASAASQLGDGRVLANHDATGIVELDLLGTALSESSQRINDALARERRFSADVSHQLRTPLAGLRLRFEAAGPADDPEVLAGAALGDLGRLEQTVTHLLAFARDAVPTTSTCSIDRAVSLAAARWTQRAAAHQRMISVSVGHAAAVRGSATSVEQILDVLIDNALDHGTGTVSLTVRDITGGGAIDVADEGETPQGGPDADIFRRGHGTNHGIGLALARSIAEAEGGRLLLARHQPTTFTLILLAADER